MVLGGAIVVVSCLVSVTGHAYRSSLVSKARVQTTETLFTFSSADHINGPYTLDVLAMVRVTLCALGLIEGRAKVVWLASGWWYHVCRLCRDTCILLSKYLLVVSRNPV